MWHFLNESVRENKQHSVHLIRTRYCAPKDNSRAALLGLKSFLQSVNLFAVPDAFWPNSDFGGSDDVLLYVGLFLIFPTSATSFWKSVRLYIICYLSFCLLTLYFTKFSFFRKRKLQYCMCCVTVCDIGWLLFLCALLPAKVLLFSSLHLTHSKKIVSRWHFLGIMCQHESSKM